MEDCSRYKKITVWLHHIFRPAFIEQKNKMHISWSLKTSLYVTIYALSYTCYDTILLSSFISAESLCPCVCDSIANQNLSHYSFDELKIILAPVTDKLRQTLSVDTSTLSSTIYKRTCMQDDRPSSKRIGYCGIGFLCSVFSTLLLIDITSFKCFGTFK